jgi:4a-hydroxytetrahydrobiopterin dehydratase
MQQSNPTWSVNDDKLSKNFVFPDFKSALAFVNRVGEIAEELGHHPEIYFTYGKVTITTTSHDAGNKITAKDEALIKQIDLIE